MSFPEIHCPICDEKMESSYDNVYKCFRYFCTFNCFCEHHSYIPILKLDKDYNCYSYFIPFILKNKIYYLAHNKYTKNTIIAEEHYTRILIDVPAIPIDIKNTKNSANQIINRLTKLLPFS
jgi:hypothetical protein